MKKINSTTWKHIQKDDWRERLEVIIGDDKQPDFKLQIKIQKWDNEVNASFRLVDDEKVLPIIKEEGKKLKYIKRKKELHFYNIEPNEKLREGGYEFEVILKEKPSTNKLEFTIRTKGLKFYYQPPLTEEITEEQKKKGWTATETEIKNEKGKRVCYRPENVVGSYAVYHATKGAMSNVKGGKLYRVGKAFHIYRPKITDANGNWTWGKLNIDEKNGILTIEIDQNFLDKAVYPVKIDPTFGYETAGSSTGNYINDQFRGSYYSSGGTGTVDSITAALVAQSSAGGKPIKCALYQQSDSSYIGTTVEWTGITNSFDDWHTFAASGTINITNQDYYLVAWSDAGSPFGGTLIYLRYDANSAIGGYDFETYGTWPDPASFTSEDCKYSIYCTYTAGGGAETKEVKMTARGQIKQESVEKKLTAKARIKGEISKVLTARGRIEQADITKLVQAQGRIKTPDITKAISSKGRIQQSGIEKVLTSQGRILTTLEKAVSSRADIKRVIEKLLTSQARLRTTIDKTLTTKGRIKQVDITKILISKARIQTLGEKVLSALSRIEITPEKLIQARGKIEKIRVKTISAKADIKVFGITKTIQALLRILRTEDKLVQAQARIQRLKEKQLQSKARIQTLQEKIVSALARIKELAKEKQLTTQARVKQADITKALTAQSRILALREKVLTSRGRIKQEGVEKTLTSKARIGLLAKTKTFSTKADILNFIEKLVQTQARIKIEAITKTLAARAYLKLERIKQAQAKARIKRTGVSAMFGAMARILSRYADIWTRILNKQPSTDWTGMMATQPSTDWTGIMATQPSTDWTNVSKPEY